MSLIKPGHGVAIFGWLPLLGHFCVSGVVAIPYRSEIMSEASPKLTDNKNFLRMSLVGNK